MSSLVLMRFLEGAPARYDRGMQLLTLGGWRRTHALVAALAAREAGARVLDLGCGTGALAALLLERGARVTGIDQNPDMLDRARARLAATSPERLRLEEGTAAEIDRLEPGSFDAVTASLLLSELSRGERGYVLRAAARLLSGGGRLVVADEVTPKGVILRALHGALRAPLALLAWTLTGAGTRPIPDPAGELAAAGLRVREERRSRLGSFAVLVAERPTA